MIYKKHTQADVAKEYRTTVSTISCIVSKARQNPDFLAEIMFEHKRKAALRDVIRDKIEELADDDEFLDSIDTVQKYLKRQCKLKVKKELIRSIMVKDLGMSFKKVNSIAWAANS